MKDNDVEITAKSVESFKSVIEVIEKIDPSVSDKIIKAYYNINGIVFVMMRTFNNKNPHFDMLESPSSISIVDESGTVMVNYYNHGFSFEIDPNDRSATFNFNKKFRVEGDK